MRPVLERKRHGKPNTGTGFAAAIRLPVRLHRAVRRLRLLPVLGVRRRQPLAKRARRLPRGVDTANSRNFKAGVNLFFNKNLNHVNVEFGTNHGLSAYGPSSITGAGYVPTSLDPLTPGGPRRAFTNSLANPTFKSLLVQWILYL